MSAAADALEKEVAGGEAIPRRRSGVRSRFFANRTAALALAAVIALVLVALLAPLLAPYDPAKQNLLLRLAPPGSPGHLLGTDEFGRDVLSRLIFGARVSMVAVAEAIAIGVLAGVPLGLLAGYGVKWFDDAASRIIDALMSVPGIILAVTMVAVLGRGLTNAMLAVGVILIPRFFRVARAATVNVRGETFIEASRAIGMTGWRILWRHVFPNALSPLVVQISLSLGMVVTAEASLSFLGLAVQPPTPSWGNMLAGAYSNIAIASFLVYAPGLAIALTVLAFMYIGDGLREALGAGPIS
jgi:peptide/nickel transport system permease protein